MVMAPNRVVLAVSPPPSLHHMAESCNVEIVPIDGEAISLYLDEDTDLPGALVIGPGGRVCLPAVERFCSQNRYGRALVLTKSRRGRNKGLAALVAKFGNLKVAYRQQEHTVPQTLQTFLHAM